jgi:hypothetical protein
LEYRKHRIIMASLFHVDTRNPTDRNACERVPEFRPRRPLEAVRSGSPTEAKLRQSLYDALFAVHQNHVPACLDHGDCYRDSSFPEEVPPAHKQIRSDHVRRLDHKTMKRSKVPVERVDPRTASNVNQALGDIGVAASFREAARPLAIAGVDRDALVVNQGEG